MATAFCLPRLSLPQTPASLDVLSRARHGDFCDFRFGDLDCVRAHDCHEPAEAFTLSLSLPKFSLPLDRALYLRDF
jgi:hypothetical protein